MLSWVCMWASGLNFWNSQDRARNQTEELVNSLAASASSARLTSSQVATHKVLKSKEFATRTLLHFQQARADGSAHKAGTRKKECLSVIPQNERESSHLLPGLIPESRARSFDSRMSTAFSAIAMTAALVLPRTSSFFVRSIIQEST